MSDSELDYGYSDTESRYFRYRDPEFYSDRERENHDVVDKKELSVASDGTSFFWILNILMNRFFSKNC